MVQSPTGASAKAPGAVDADNRGDFTPNDWALFLAISLIWGASFLLIAFALEDLTPGVVTLGRVALGAATLMALRLTRRGQLKPIDRGDWPRVLILSGLWVAVPFTLFPLAQEHINSALTGLLNGGVPVFAAVVSTVFFGRRPGPAQLAGIATGFVGIVLISLPSLGSGSSEATGIVLVLLATLCYGISVNIAAPLQSKYGAISLMSPILGLATIWVVPFSLRDISQNTSSLGSIVSVVILGCLGTGIAYWIMATLVGRVGPVRASFITYLIPVVSLTLGIMFRNDSVAPLALIGAGLVIVGAVLASRRDD